MVLSSFVFSFYHYFLSLLHPSLSLVSPVIWEFSILSILIHDRINFRISFSLTLFLLYYCFLPVYFLSSVPHLFFDWCWFFLFLLLFYILLFLLASIFFSLQLYLCENESFCLSFHLYNDTCIFIFAWIFYFSIFFSFSLSVFVSVSLFLSLTHP